MQVGLGGGEGEEKKENGRQEERKRQGKKETENSPPACLTDEACRAGLVNSYTVYDLSSRA